MSATLHSLIEAWLSKRRPDDPYGSVEAFAEGESSGLWPYAIAHEQIDLGEYDGDYRGALALNLAKSYRPYEHALAALVTLGGKWPASNATSALNLLALAHRVAPSSGTWLDTFLSRASLECIKQGLSDPRAVVSEEAANILGGLGSYHFAGGAAQDVADLRELARAVVGRIDQPDVVVFLNDRVQTVLDDATNSLGTKGLCEADAAQVLKEMEPQWARIGHSSKDLEPLVTLRTHVTALAWKLASREPAAIQVVHVYSNRAKDKEQKHQGWSIIEPWFAVVRSMVQSVDNLIEGTAASLDFVPVSAAGGSLFVTLRVVSDHEELIARGLRAARSKPVMTSAAAEELSDMLRLQGIKIRVAHIGRDLSSASLGIGPDGSGVAGTPLRSRKLETGEIPQANELERIFDLVDCVATGRLVTPDSIGVTTERQVQYYKAASRLLSLLAEPTDVLTRTGWLLHVAKGNEERYRRISTAFEASACGQAWLEWANATRLSEIPADSGEGFLADRSALAGDTVSRRASTINRWLEKLRQYS